MSNVIAINAAAKKSIAAARATSDEMLLQSIAKGDRTSMHVLYSRHNVRVYRFVLRMVRDTTMAEDLVSQVFLDVWRTASQFEGRSQVSTWLLSIARFKALTALRQRKHEDIEQEDVLEIADEADTPEASLDRSNTSAILRACVAKLSPAHREIINLVYLPREVGGRGRRDHRDSPEHGEDPDVLCPQTIGRSCLRAPAWTASLHKAQLLQ
jgi:RNA polymerase sigma-70 factor (ECF subfamily)